MVLVQKPADLTRIPGAKGFDSVTYTAFCVRYQIKYRALVSILSSDTWVMSFCCHEGSQFEPLLNALVLRIA